MKRKIIIALAYFHRYGWIALLLLSLYLFPHASVLFVFSILYSVWTFIGYKYNWKHVFCSFQNMNHQKMTPNSISWDLIKKSDVWCIILIFAFLGIAEESRTHNARQGCFCAKNDSCRLKYARYSFASRAVFYHKISSCGFVEV